jgi:transaldolase
MTQTSTTETATRPDNTRAGSDGGAPGAGADGAASPLERLSALGQSVWIDFLSRQSTRSGHLQQLIDQDAVVGATSNPTILQKAMSEGDAYDDEIAQLARDTDDCGAVFWKLAERDVGEACEVFHAVWERTQQRDGYVSIEVDPRLAYETLASFREAMRLHAEIDKPNLLVKIPATRPGLAAIEDAIAKGRSINVTLIFSLRRYEEVVESYLRGLERLIAEGGDPRHVTSVASFFVSRIDTEADKRLDAIGGHDDLKGRLAIANARLAYQHYKDAFHGPRWEFLAAKGAKPQRVLWASTSTKNPAYPDTLYVDELIGPETINTMPEETILAYRDHGRPELRLEAAVEDAKRLFEELARVGVNYDDVTATLEREGVQKFEASFAEAVDALASKVATAAR